MQENGQYEEMTSVFIGINDVAFPLQGLAPTHPSSMIRSMHVGLRATD